MSVKRVREEVDPKSGIETVVLEDSFGHQHIVQIPLLVGFDPDLGTRDERSEQEHHEQAEAVIEKVKLAMEEREKLLEKRILRRGYDLNKLSKDCGCS